jgi:PEP-CTERM motif-containing protein
MITSIRAIGVALLACTATLFAGGASAAPVVYEGSLLSSGISQTGSVPTGDGWINNRGNEVDYWAFSAFAGQEVTINVHPIDPRLDPAFSFYSGITAADTTQFTNFDDWGGITFIDFGAALSGGGGLDAERTFTAAANSLFTIAVGGWESAGCPAQCAPGPFAYQITVTGNIPEPITLALVGIGIAGIGFTRRKTSNKRRQVS